MPCNIANNLLDYLVDGYCVNSTLYSPVRGEVTIVILRSQTYRKEPKIHVLCWTFDATMAVIPDWP